MVGGAALLAAAAVFYVVNYPAAVSTAATTRQLPIYSVERAQKVCAISFDAAWGEGKVRHRCREREQDRAINAWGYAYLHQIRIREKLQNHLAGDFAAFFVFYYHRSTRADTVLTGRNARISPVYRCRSFLPAGAPLPALRRMGQCRFPQHKGAWTADQPAGVHGRLFPWDEPQQADKRKRANPNHPALRAGE